MTWKETEKRWLELGGDSVRTALQNMTESERENAFTGELEFGTAGFRGILGAGPNRMNDPVVMRATQGVCSMLLEKGCAGESIVVGYDTRHQSREFAEAAARVCAANGFVALLSDAVMPTPVVSYAIRHEKAAAGVMITASHNAAIYNGYKLYGPDGGQLTKADTAVATSFIRKTDYFGENGPSAAEYDKAVAEGKIVLLNPENGRGRLLFEDYVREARGVSLRKELNRAGLRMVYTPLHGAGMRYFESVLAAEGYQVSYVKEQVEPDGAFPTCPDAPNPANRKALVPAIRLAKQEKIDLILSSDPDSDRLGAAIRYGEDYRVLTGNEIGALLLDYICETRTLLNTMPKAPLAVKTVVTSRMAEGICARYNVELVQTLTGFKYIGETLENLAEKGEESRYLFGFEESNSFLVGTYARDKDAVSAGVLFAEMIAWNLSEGRTPAQAVDRMEAKYGKYYLDKNIPFRFEDVSVQAIVMDGLRGVPSVIAGQKVTRFWDYKAGFELDCLSGEKKKIENLPSENLVTLEMADGSRISARPSGTEPLVRFYFCMPSQPDEDAVTDTEKALSLHRNAEARMESLLAAGWAK